MNNNYISIANKNSREGKQVSTTSKFFNQPVTCKIKKDMLVFSRSSSLNEPMKLHSNQSGFSWYLKIDWPNGKYLFDEEESNENEVVIYLEQ